MDMVCIDTYFEEIEVVCGAKFQTYGFQSLCYRGSEHVPPVFHWADQVVQEERFVVTLQDVFAHQPILAPNAPAAELRGNLFEYRYKIVA